MNGNKQKLENINDYYENYYENLEKEIKSVIEEGVKEGIKEGVKKGILKGLNECIDLGLLNIKKTKIKEIDEILKEIAVETIQKETKKAVAEEVCPVVKVQMKNYCDKILDKINEDKIILDVVDVTSKLDIEKLTEKKMEKILQYIRQNLPNNFMFIAIFDGFQKGMSECLTENMKRCTKRIQNTFDIKTGGGD